MRNPVEIAMDTIVYTALFVILWICIVLMSNIDKQQDKIQTLTEELQACENNS